MAENNQTQTEQLLENEAVQEFLKLLMKNRPEEGQDFSVLLWQIEGMGRQLDAALRELNEVKTQLTGMQETQEKRFVDRVTQTVEGKIHTIQERMAEMKKRIIEGAKKAVAGFKRAGVKALDKVVSALSIKKALEQTHKDLTESISDIKQSIGKIETIGQELRSVGGHIKNVGRVMTGKEQQKIDGGKEGRFQSAVLSPLRLQKNILTKLNNLTLSAIGSVERLEQAAGREKEEAVPEIGHMEQKETALDHKKEAEVAELSRENQPKKEKEKISLLKELQEGKEQAAAARTDPNSTKERKIQEAAL
ncbi:MAG: hypothetical protein OSJ73_10155 [Lachnospiraceae bacterium]|jgi:hypothetical protein|nr:hypothetical protein [Lachnospiraceae bacterium]